MLMCMYMYMQTDLLPSHKSGGWGRGGVGIHVHVHTLLTSHNRHVSCSALRKIMAWDDAQQSALASWLRFGNQNAVRVRKEKHKNLWCILQNQNHHFAMTKSYILTNCICICLCLFFLYMCMFLYMYMYVWYLYVYVCVCVRVSVCLGACVCVCVCMYTHMYIYIIYTCIYIYICMWMYIYTHINICLYMYIYVYIYKHARQLTQVSSCNRGPGRTIDSSVICMAWWIWTQRMSAGNWGARRFLQKGGPRSHFLVAHVADVAEFWYFLNSSFWASCCLFRTTPQVLVQEQLQNFVKAVAPEIPTLPEGSLHQGPKWGLSLAGCCGQARVAGHLWARCDDVGSWGHNMPVDAPHKTWWIGFPETARADGY